MPKPLLTTRTLKVAADGAKPTDRVVAEETAIALVYDGTTHAVMMATPADLEDFAVGFSVGERLVDSPDEIREIAIVEQSHGIEIRLWLQARATSRVVLRRRAMLGPTACGLCGVDSLAAATPALSQVDARLVVTAQDIFAAMSSLLPAQLLNTAAHALHAAGFWVPGSGLMLLREDVGRHNALDKLVGALLRGGHDPAGGIVVLTSRVSIEMIQKAATLGVPLIAAMSAPTALALRAAKASGLTLVAVARQNGFEVFTNRWRVDVDCTSVASGRASHHVGHFE